MFVFLFGGGFVVFVFHFKHDGDDFVACAVLLAEDVVTFAAAGGIVVFAELGLGEGGGADAVELGFAMGFQAFADHFGGLAGFEVFVEGDFFGFLFELDFVAFAQGVLGELVLAVAQLQLGGKLGEFAFFGGEGFADGKFTF